MAGKGNHSENNKRSDESPSQNDNSQDSLSKKARKTGQIPRKRLVPFLISLIIVVISSATADILIKYSMSGNRAPKVHSASGIPYAVVEALANPWLDVAIVLMIIQFVTFAHTLRVGPLSLIVPIRGASTYIVTTVLAMIFLHEKVSPQRWGSILVILLGVVIIGFTGQGKKS